MILAGTTAYVQPGYRPQTRWALEWHQKMGGAWRARDRAVAEDKYLAVVNLELLDAELAAVEAALAANRNTFSMTFFRGEEVFGADVNYANPYTVCIDNPTNYATRRTSFNFSAMMGLKLRLVGAPTFLGVVPSLDALRLSDFDYEAHSQMSVERQVSYSGAVSHADSEVDPGYFEANFRQTFQEMQAIRRFILTNRSAAFTFPPAIGVTHPFGKRMGTGPFQCRIVDWEDLGPLSLDEWQIRIRFAREF